MSVDLEPRRIVSLEEDGSAVDMEVYLEVEIEDHEKVKPNGVSPKNKK